MLGWKFSDNRQAAKINSRLPDGAPAAGALQDRCAARMELLPALLTRSPLFAKRGTAIGVLGVKSGIKGRS
jgi:hypothetical protein